MSRGTPKHVGTGRSDARTTRSAHARSGGASVRRFVVAATCGVLLELVLAALIGLRDAAPGEPLVLRWLRIVADHPARTALALALALWAFLPAPDATPRARSSSAAADGDGAPR